MRMPYVPLVVGFGALATGFVDRMTTEEAEQSGTGAEGSTTIHECLSMSYRRCGVLADGRRISLGPTEYVPNRVSLGDYLQLLRDYKQSWMGPLLCTTRGFLPSGWV